MHATAGRRGRALKPSAAARRQGDERAPGGCLPGDLFSGPKTARLFCKLYIGGTASYLMACSAAGHICEQAGCSRPLLFRRGTGAGTAQIFRARTVGLLVRQKGIEIGRLFQIMFRWGSFGLSLTRIVTRLGELFGYVFRRGTYGLLLAKTGTEIGRLFWIMLRRGTFGVFLCGKGELFFHTCFGT